MTVDPLREFDDGVAYWATRPQWPADLHNAFYADQYAITDGTFNPDWWFRTRRKLHNWRATRGASYADLDSRFQQHHAELVAIWEKVVHPRAGNDITAVTWEEVRALPDLAALIKPTRDGSGVFPSKLSHFIAPCLFPVLDKTALPGGEHRYGVYFNLVKDTWHNTDPADQRALRLRLTAVVEAHSGSMFDGFPIVNKIVELRLIGRHHPLPA